MLGLLTGLEGWYGPFRLFGYVTTRTVLAALTAFILMMLIMPPLIRMLRRLKLAEQGSKGEIEIVDAMREQKAGTPTMGGLGIIVSIVVTAVLWCHPGSQYTWLLCLGLLSFGAIGFIDDRTKLVRGAQGLSKRGKMLLQLLLGCGFGFWLLALDAGQIWGLQPGAGGLADTYVHVATLHGHLTLPFLPVEQALPLGLGLVVWVIVMTFACSNSVNFTDGMDGLAAGTMLIAALAFVVIAYLASRIDAAAYLRVFYVPGGQEVAVFSAAIAGACLGFLWFNGAPALVFMGDTGSQALGGVLALIATAVKQEFLLLLVGFVFFMEGASVAMQVGWFKATGGRRIFRCAPIHHHFQCLGWPETRIVIRFWIIAGLAALLAVASLKVR